MLAASASPAQSRLTSSPEHEQDHELHRAKSTQGALGLASKSRRAFCPHGEWHGLCGLWTVTAEPNSCSPGRLEGERSPPLLPWGSSWLLLCSGPGPSAQVSPFWPLNQSCRPESQGRPLAPKNKQPESLLPRSKAAVQRLHQASQRMQAKATRNSKSQAAQRIKSWSVRLCSRGPAPWPANHCLATRHLRGP